MIDQFRVWITSQLWFWESRTRWENVKFQIESNFYQGANRLAKVKASARILGNIAWVAFGGLLLVILIVALLVLLEGYLRENTDLILPLNDEEKKYNIEQIRIYAQILTGMFSIYFATIGIIVSAGYTRFRTDIIQLLTTEQVGSVYSKLVVLSAAFCLISASLPFFGKYPDLLIGSVSMILTLASSLALFPLGQRLFNFFDVSLLMRSEVIPRIARHIASAANPKSSISMANHHSKEAKIGLDQLAYIDDRMLADIGHLASTLPKLTDAYSSLLLHYLHRKHQIDHNSYWFPRDSKHKQWFLSSDSATSLALQTSSQLSVEETPNLNWFEESITKRLLGHIELAFEEENYNLAHDLIARFSYRIAPYARGLQLARGLDELNQIKSLIETAFASKRPSLTPEINKIWISISDTWATLGGNLCLETLRRIFVFEGELNHFFARDVWTRKTLSTLPTFLQVELQFIVDRIDFEQAIEGRRLSLPKYLQQLTLQKLLKQYVAIIPMIPSFFDKTLQDHVILLQKLNLHQAATQVILGSLHNYWKLPRWFEDIGHLWARYREFAHYTEEVYQLPNIDLEVIQNDLAAIYDRSIEKLADPAFVEPILGDKQSDDLPDHFGQIYFELIEAAINALEKNDEKQFSKILPTVLSLCVASDIKFANQELDLSNEYKLHLVSTTINDLASVLGYAILYSHYFSNPALQEVAVQNFEALLDRATDKAAYLKRMLILSNPRGFSLSASPRAIIRIAWQQRLESQARRDGYSTSYSFGSGKAHENPMLDKFFRSHSHGSHFFLATQVLPLVQPKDFDIDHQITALANALNDNESRDEL